MARSSLWLLINQEDKLSMSFTEKFRPFSLVRSTPPGDVALWWEGKTATSFLGGSRETASSHQYKRCVLRAGPPRLQKSRGGGGGRWWRWPRSWRVSDE